MTALDSTITIRDAAVCLGISTQAIYRLVGRGTLTAHDTPGGKVLDWDEVHARLSGSTEPVRPPRIAKAVCREYVEAESGRSVTDVPRTSLLGYAMTFIDERRPRWDDDRRNQWVLDFEAWVDQMVDA